MQKFVEYCERPPNRCKVCEWRATTDANKAEGRRLMAEVARRRAAGLPEYPIDAHQPYPADLAWAAEERRLGLSNGIPPSPKDCYLDPDLAEGEEPGASPGESRHPDRSAQRAVEGPPHLPSPSSAPPHVEDPHNPALPNPSPETWAKFAAHLPNIKASAEDPTEPGAPSSTAHTTPTAHTVLPTSVHARARHPSPTRTRGDRPHCTTAFSQNETPPPPHPQIPRPPPAPAA
jgi:hypothetical protein